MNEMKSLTLNGTKYDSFYCANAVSVVEQTLTEEQKAQARANIGIVDTVETESIQVQRIATLSNTSAKPCKIKNWSLPDGVDSMTITTCGKNLLDTSVVSNGTIKNDAGAEVADYNGRYWLTMIPVIPGEVLRFNFGFQRVYHYDQNKQWLSRSQTYDIACETGTKDYTIPDNCYFIQIQWSLASNSYNTDKRMLEVGAVETAYEPYSCETVTITADSPSTVQGLSLHDGYTRISCDAMAAFTVEYEMDGEKDNVFGITVPECAEYPVWLCDSSTDAYQTEIGQDAATCTLSYADFLTQYFDCYITSHADRYSVTKKSLGRDSANKYDIYEYTFTPKRYSRTVMLSGGMNACELPAEFGIAYFIKNVMEKTSDAFAWLHDNVRFKIIPVICPWSFDQSPMVYENFNGVSLNKNFDYNHCWEDYSAGGAGTKGEAPCSEAETKMLLRWINANANNCDLWIDCHTDSSGIAADATANLHAVICSDSATTALISDAQAKITQAYITAGYFQSGADKTGTGAWTEQGGNYPKTLYARHICGIPSIMIEQYVGNPYYGGTKTIANTSADINNYVTMLRAYVLAVLKREAITITGEDFAWYIYQSMMANHFLADDTGIDEPDAPEGNILSFAQGGINGDGTFSTAAYRAHSDFIEVPPGKVLEITNMGNYTVVDIGVWEADKTTFRELTTNRAVTFTHTGDSLLLSVVSDFYEVYPTGKYIVFSLKRLDAQYGAIDLADLANCKVIVR